MPSVAETTLEMIQLVLPEHANTRGTLYGGTMMNWITTASTMAAMKVAPGPGGRRPGGRRTDPAGTAEETLVAAARARKAERDAALLDRGEQAARVEADD